jgi:hypothetical protein
MLFKTTAEIQQFAPINGEVNFASLKSSIITAERECIIPAIGQSLYDTLNTAYAANTLTTPQTNLLAVIQQSLACYAIYAQTPLSEVNFTDGGTRREETNTSKSAYQYQVTNLRKELLRQADLHLEYLLGYLETNRTDFPTWTSSTQFLRYRGLFIKTGTEFSENYTTASPNRNYIAMRPTMEDVEQQIVKKLLGKDFFAALKAKDKAEQDFTADETELLYKLKKWIAALTVLMSIPKINVQVTDNGITVFSSSTFATKDDDSKRGAANADQINHLVNSLKDTCSMWLADITAYLKETASVTVFAPYYEWQLTVAAAEAAALHTPEESIFECGSTYGLI